MAEGDREADRAPARIDRGATQGERQEGTKVFEYFPGNYPWSLAVMSALNRGGQISEVDDACRPLKEISTRRNDPAAQDAWLQSWM